MQRIDLTGKRFGRLVAIKPADHSSSKGNLIWLCRCDCGNYIEVDGQRLRRGETRSCGCLRRDQSREVAQTNEQFQKNVGNSTHFFNDDGVPFASIRRSKRNKSGHVGVSYDKKTNRWVSRLMYDGHYVLLKTFETFDEAVEARENAEDRYLKNKPQSADTSASSPSSDSNH